MNPIIINITLGMEEQQGFAFRPKVTSKSSFDNAVLKESQKEKLIAQLNQLITNAINETLESTIFHTNIDKRNDSLSPTTEVQISRLDKQWLKKVEQILIKEMSNSQFNVNSLADTLNISRSKVHRQIKRITGLTPNKYIRQLKLQTARDILEKAFGKRPLSYIRVG